jgi:flagellar hook-length control protein FliK
LDVPQINIKINQTKKADVGKSSLKDPKVNAFEKIVSKVKKLVEQSDVHQTSKGSLNSAKEVTDPSETSEAKNMSDSDWEQLDELLSMLISTLQTPSVQQTQAEQPDSEVQQTQVVLTDLQMQMNASSVLNTIETQMGQPSILSQSTGGDTAMANQMSMLPAVKDLLQQLQKSGEVFTTDNEQLSIDLSNMLNEDQNGLLTLPDNIRDKIQTLVKQLQIPEKPQMSEAAPSVLLSLDKNQVMFQKEGQNSEVPKSNRIFITKEDGKHSMGMPAMTNNSLQGYGVRNVESPIKQTPVVTVSELGHEVSDMAAKLVRITGGQSGKSEATFSLYPQHLGHVEVKIFSQAGQISAQIIAGTPQAKEALEGQLQHLRTALMQQGLQVEKLDVMQQTSQTSGNSLAFSQGGGSNFSQQQSFTSSQGPSKRQDEPDQTDFEKDVLPVSYRGSVPNKASHIDFTA